VLKSITKQVTPQGGCSVYKPQSETEKKGLGPLRSQATSGRGRTGDDDTGAQSREDNLKTLTWARDRKLRESH